MIPPMSEHLPLRVGVLGCGNIARKQYLPNLRGQERVRVVACADLRREAAESAAADFGVPAVLEADELLNSDEIDCVLNLTVPAVHAQTGRRAVAAGKHVFGEKPLAVDLAEATALLEEADAAGVRVGTAPDTFLGAGQQTARRAIDEGLIGKPLHFEARMLGGGMEHWHPNPDFFYQPGGGPMFDMGPYYLTALVNLFGAVTTVSCFADRKVPVRTITHGASGKPGPDDGTRGPRYGETFEIVTPDHLAALLRFDNGVTGTFSTSFATRVSFHDRARPITVYGTEGSLRVADPNGFDTLPILQRHGEDEPRELPGAVPAGVQRGAGLIDLAEALGEGRPHRCSGEFGRHVLAVMQACLDSQERECFIPTRRRRGTAGSGACESRRRFLIRVPKGT